MTPQDQQVAWNIAAGAAGGAVRHILRFMADPKRRWPALVAGTVTGTFCATFLTPLTAHAIGWSDEPAKTTGLAFLLGCMGMEAVELMLIRVRKTLGTEGDK
jgi:hypothetical protein